MYPRGRKVCFATAGFLLIAKTRIYLRSCGIPTGKKRAGLACGIGNILRAGRPSGGQPSFPGRLAGRREAAAKRGTGNAPWRRRKEGRRGGAAVFCQPGGPAKPKQGQGPKAPAPALCALCAPAARGGREKPGPTLYGPGRRKTLVGRGGAGRDALGKAAAHALRAAAASFACRGLPGQENCSGRCANIAVRAAPLPAQGPLPTIYGQRRHHSLAAGCRVKRIAADGARISPCAQGL